MHDRRQSTIIQRVGLKALRGHALRYEAVGASNHMASPTARHYHRHHRRAGDGASGVTTHLPGTSSKRLTGLLGVLVGGLPGMQFW